MSEARIQLPTKYTLAARAGTLALGLCLGACGGAKPENGPVDALTHFLEAMDRSSSNEHALADAYAYLDDADQRALSQRAAQAALMAGRDFEPWEMLVQGRFRRRLVPAEHGGMRARVQGDHAVVVVSGSDGKSRAQVPMVRRGGSWRVQLGVPALGRDARGAEPQP